MSVSYYEVAKSSNSPVLFMDEEQRNVSQTIKDFAQAPHGTAGDHGPGDATARQINSMNGV
jgi:hypothetical protein